MDCSKIRGEGQTIGQAQHTPITAFLFRKIRAASDIDAIRTAEEETHLLNDILSAKRGSYGRIVVGLMIDILNKGIAVIPRAKIYSGNLMGGFLSGEAESELMELLSNVRKKPRAKLYLSLYTSALKEEDIEFRYFKLWSLLEVIARNNGYLGKPRLDFNGVQILSSKGKPMQIEDKAEQLVFELIREKILPGISMSSFTALGKTLEEMVAIWYRHRNCMGHEAGCTPNDPKLCDPANPKYALCKGAHDATVQQFKACHRSPENRPSRVTPKPASYCVTVK